MKEGRKERNQGDLDLEVVSRWDVMKAEVMVKTVGKEIRRQILETISKSI